MKPNTTGINVGVLLFSALCVGIAFLLSEDPRFLPIYLWSTGMAFVVFVLFWRAARQGYLSDLEALIQQLLREYEEDYGDTPSGKKFLKKGHEAFIDGPGGLATLMGINSESWLPLVGVLAVKGVEKWLGAKTERPENQIEREQELNALASQYKSIERGAFDYYTVALLAPVVIAGVTLVFALGLHR